MYSHSLAYTLTTVTYNYLLTRSHTHTHTHTHTGQDDSWLQLLITQAPSPPLFQRRHPTCLPAFMLKQATLIECLQGNSHHQTCKLKCFVLFVMADESCMPTNRWSVATLSMVCHMT